MTELEKQFEELNDDALLNLVLSKSCEYTEEALEAAKNELRRRNIEFDAKENEYKIKLEKAKEFGYPVFFTNARDSDEAGIYKSILESKGIPVFFKVLGGTNNIDAFITETNSVIEIYVPEMLYEIANKAIEEDIVKYQEKCDDINLDTNDTDSEPCIKSSRNKEIEPLQMILFVICSIIGFCIFIGIIEQFINRS